MVYFNYILIATVVSVGCWVICSVLIGPMLEDVSDSLTTVKDLLNKPCPKGVKTPVYEICQAVLSNPKRFRIDTESVHNLAYGHRVWRCGIVDRVYGVEYNVRESSYSNNLYYVDNIILPVPRTNVKITFTKAEIMYIGKVCRVVAKWHKKRKERLCVVQDLRERRKLAKLYSQPSSEVTQNDQTN